MSALSKTRLLFVCVENANRSQMAQVFAKIHGGDQVEAYSAGSRPSGKVNPKAIEAMKELTTISRNTNRLHWTTFPTSNSTRSSRWAAATSAPSSRRNNTSTGKSPIRARCRPPEEFRQVRDLICAKVKELIASLDSAS